MALQGGHGSLLYALSAPLPSETRRVREEAPARQQPAAGRVSDAAGQEDPAKRGVYPGKPGDDSRCTTALTRLIGFIQLNYFSSVVV